MARQRTEPNPAAAPPPESVQAVTVLRFATGEDGATPESEDVQVAVEAPVVIDVQDGDSYTIYCSPTDMMELAVGFLLAEGLIDRFEDLEELRPCEYDPRTVRVRLRKAPKPGGVKRHLPIVSACGLCGSEAIDRLVRALPRSGDTLRLPTAAIRTAAETLRREQRVFPATGGTHAVGLFDAAGVFHSFAEDIGRHNAMDKAIGRLLLAGGEARGLAAMLSGRASLEMLVKAARAGLEAVVAVSAPTSLAVHVAERCHITLCAFVRGTRATAFAYPHRLETALSLTTSGGPA